MKYIFPLIFLASSAFAWYVGTSGQKYKYDLSNSLDRTMYSIDVTAQYNDSYKSKFDFGVQRRVQQDISNGQFGGGYLDW